MFDLGEGSRGGYEGRRQFDPGVGKRWIRGLVVLVLRGR